MISSSLESYLLIFPQKLDFYHQSNISQGGTGNPNLCPFVLSTWKPEYCDEGKGHINRTMLMKSW